MAEPDHVTGLESRAAFEAFFARLPAPSPQMALVMCDVVGLKQVNEEAGFTAGDLHLRLAAARLRSAAASADMVARLGGDELIAAFVGSHAAAAAERAAAQLAGGSMPVVRAAATVRQDGETCGATIDRLYAIVRHS